MGVSFRDVILSGMRAKTQAVKKTGPGYAPPGAAPYGPPSPAGMPMQQYGTGSPQMVPQQQRRGMGTGAAVGMGVGALAAGGLAGYALGGGFNNDNSPTEEVNVSSFSESVDFGGDDWME